MDTTDTGAKSAEQRTIPQENRNTWIFTAYAICGIVFFGVMAYYASLYFAK
jgi:hypothetical protein